MKANNASMSIKSNIDDIRILIRLFQKINIFVAFNKCVKTLRKSKTNKKAFYLLRVI